MGFFTAFCAGPPGATVASGGLRSILPHAQAMPTYTSMHDIRAASADEKPKPRLSYSEIMRKAGKRALGGGIPGAVAMATQVVTLLPLRTTMNVRSTGLYTISRALLSLSYGTLVRNVFGC